MSNPPRLCPICRTFIHDPSPNQKYHQGGCNKTAKEISRIRSLINAKLDALLSS
jgi:hypothetical protein